VDTIFPLIVPALCSQLVSSRSGAVSASFLLDALSSQTSKPHLLTAAYVATLQLHRSNVRLQAAVVDKLAGACVVEETSVRHVKQCLGCRLAHLLPAHLLPPLPMASTVSVLQRDPRTLALLVYRPQSPSFSFSPPPPPIHPSSGVLPTALSHKPEVVERQVLPALFPLLDVAKSEVRAAVGKALCACGRSMGNSALLAAACTLSEESQSKLKALLQ
jgi:hypothetical protein